MKVVVRPIYLLLIVSWFLLGCSAETKHKSKTIIQKVEVDDDLRATETPWGISDGIKVIQESQKEYFYFSIESHPGQIRNHAQITFTYRKDSLNKVIYEKNIIYPTDSIYPYYWLNTLDVFETENTFGAYFFTQSNTYPYGIEPFELNLWVYYNERLYKFSGTLSRHKDWPWEEHYSYKPDTSLKDVSSETFMLIEKIWNSQVKKYKAQFNND